IHFPVEKSEQTIRVFTTRPDTIFGTTFMCLAPEHPLVKPLTEGTGREAGVSAFVERMSHQSRSDRLLENYEKEGVFTGAWCRNPLSDRPMPVYIANFALMEYGTGAVMAVPAHDQRDFDFAKKYDLPIVPVICPPEVSEEEVAREQAYTGAGVLINSGQFNDMDSEAAKEAITDHLEHMKMGSKAVSYRLRDWGISRQRYWGAPIPVIHCPACGTVPVREEDLPVVLPEDVDLLEGGGSPLASTKSFVQTQCPQCGGPARRETDTMDTFVESSWYFERYCSPNYDKGMFDPSATGYWMPVDQYIGGVEHAVMHLLYSRYFTRVLHDLGLVDFKEPFTRLLTQGMVCKETVRCPEHGFLYPEETYYNQEQPHCRFCDRSAELGRVEKMSKSKKNVVDPNVLLDTYGADTVRLFCLFAAPPERSLEWSEQGVEGSFRFLNRVWRIIYQWQADIAEAQSFDGSLEELDGPGRELFGKAHQTIRKVSNDIEERFHFNTAISAVMELVNSMYTAELNPGHPHTAAAMRFAAETVILLLAPVVPHITEELWQALGNEASSPSAAEWPGYRQDALASETREMVAQVNGKLRGRFEIAADADEESVKEAALADENVQRFIRGKTVKKVIVVKDKLVNVVV
ncbi:MAG: leucine--tRNA ligase, partial [Desulfosalsimonadaceae bacterium]